MRAEQGRSRHRRLSVAHALAFAILCVYVPVAAFAQQGTEPGPPPAPVEFDVDRLGARVAELETREQAGQVSEAEREELAALRSAREYLKQAAERNAEAARFTSEARAAPEQLSQIEEYMVTPNEQLISQVDENSETLASLQTQLQAANSRLRTEQELRARVDQDADSRTKRREAIPAERAAALERIESLDAEIAAGAASEDSPGVAEAKKWARQAEKYFQQVKLHALGEELRNYDVRRPLLDKRRAYRDRRVAIETRNINALTEAIGRKQIEQAEQAEREAARQRREAANAHQAVQQVLDRNQEITARNTELLERKRAHAEAKVQAETRLAEWQSAFTRSKQRVEKVGLTNAIGQHLRGQLNRLPSETELRQQISARDRTIGELVNESQDWSLLAEELEDLDEQVDEQISNSSQPVPSVPERLEELRTALHESLAQQRGYVEELSTNLNDYLDNTLVELRGTERELADLIDEYTEYINERILWIRSARPLAWSVSSGVTSALAVLVDPSNWAQVGRNLWRDARMHPSTYIVGLIVILVLLIGRSFSSRRMKRIAGKTRRFSTDRVSFTFEAIGHLLIWAALWPSVLAIAAWRLSAIPVGDELAQGLSTGLWRASQLLFAATILSTLCRPGGIGEAHFRWQPATMRLLRRQVLWVAPLVVPIALIVGITSSNDRHYDSFGRLAFIAGMVIFSTFLFRLLKPGSGMLRTFLVRHPDGWIDRLKYLWFPVIVLIPIAIAVAAGMGYFYSAVQLERRLLGTGWLVLIVVVGRAIALRGLFLAQARLQIEQRKKKLAAAAEQAAEKRKAEAKAGTPESAGEPTAAEPVPGAETPVVVEAEDVDVAALSAQARQLLSATVALTVLVGLALVWIEVLPALNFLQNVELWSLDGPVLVESEATSESVSDRGSTVDDAGDSTTIGITLGDLLYAILILIVTVFVSKNMPGLLEITLLQRLPITPSGRYATTTLARYVIVIVGIVLAFDAIGVSWSKVQWLAAAITVGLGFGLQEIFANFVSGLIILFERPIRVGDTVTVSGISGTVSRIRMRATTIVAWDRKELIIPNKEFVTGDIINWTLSDPTLRLDILVGIAYGSDVKLAEKLLYQAAREDAKILPEPPPRVIFMEFGDSSLVFQLRVFIPHIDELFPTRHRLHNAIDRLFREAKITIAFPQMDVHFHTTSGGDVKEIAQRVEG